MLSEVQPPMPLFISVYHRIFAKMLRGNMREPIQVFASAPRHIARTLTAKLFASTKRWIANSHGLSGSFQNRTMILSGGITTAA
jgi:hypothetical protein